MPNFERYKEYLEETKRAEAREEQEMVEESLMDMADTGLCIQGTRNYESQWFIVNRDSTTECSVTVLPGDNLFIGDLVGVLDDYWLTMDRQIDQYGTITAKVQLCNHLLKFQDFQGNIYERWIIIEDGSVKSASDSGVNLVEGNVECYIPRDDATRCLFVDKRLAFDKVYNSLGEEELQVWKITWIDTKSMNTGEGSHLLYVRVEPDTYNRHSDNLEEMLCDYKEPKSDDGTDNPDNTEPDTPDSGGGGDDESDDTEPDTQEDKIYLKIEGSDTIRTRQSRTYTVSYIDEEGELVDAECDLNWSRSSLPEDVTMTESGNTATITVGTDAKSGSIIVLFCDDVAGVYVSDSFEVEVL